MYGLTDDELQRIREVLITCGVTRCILFGSRAKGSNKPGSDIDIAIDGNETKVSYCLNEELNVPYYFDVINIHKIKNKNLLDHIQRIGVELL